MKFIEELEQKEVTHLFKTEDLLKDLILKGNDEYENLKYIQNRIKNIYVVPTAK